MKPHLLRCRQVPCGAAFWRGVASATLVLLLLALAAGCASTAGTDPYFAARKSRANVYVAPERVDISKVAVLPFKGPTELIGASVSDLVVTEILRTRKYTLVERGQMANVLGETELALAGLSESKAV
jgi:curli biogenesis system outer membrane secretion channel CsgG